MCIRDSTGTPRRIWGPGIAMDTASEGTVLRDLDAFLARHGDLHGQADLKPRSANYVARMDTWFVDYDVMVEGIPVWRGGVTARIKHGNLIMLGLETYPRTLLEGERRIDLDTARKAAVSQGPAPAAMHDPGQARLVWLPQEVAGGVVLQLVWEVRSETYKPCLLYTSDAADE